MAFDTSTGLYTAPTGSESAASGLTIASATWNSIHTDYATAFGQLGRSNIGALCVLSADYTMTDTATAQQCFNATAAGALTVSALTTYEFEAVYLITNNGTTSHTWSTLFAGTATFTSLAYTVDAYHAAGNALTALSSIYSTVSTATVVTGASTDAAENVAIKLKGFVRINGAGTIIPQIKLSAQTNAGAATIKMLANSFFRCWPVGSNTVTTVGAWS